MNVSVIVPVYNKADVLEERICNLLNQKYDDYEIILVDDGSTDGSGYICDELANNYDKIRVFHKDNGGVSSARNLGIKKACGKYFVFCDADDGMSEDALEHLTECIEGEKADLVVGGFCGIAVNETENKIQQSCQFKRRQFKVDLKNDYIDSLWLENNIYSVCGKIFLKDIIIRNSIFFNENLVVLEDYDFVLEYLSKIRVVVSLPYNVYNYIGIEGGGASFLKRSKSDYVEDVLYVDRKQKLFFSNNMVKDDEILWKRFSVNYQMALSSVSAIRTKDIKKYLRIRDILKMPEYKKLYRNNKNKYSILMYICLVSGNIVGVLLLSKVENALRKYLHV